MDVEVAGFCSLSMFAPLVTWTEPANVVVPVFENPCNPDHVLALAVLSEIVPVVVIVPPERPVPAATDETVAFVVLHVAHPIAPVAPLYVIGDTPFKAVVEAYAVFHCVVEAESGMT